MNGTVPSPQRPIGVTIIVVLLWIQAVLGIAAGGFLIIDHNDFEVTAHLDRSSDALLVYGVVAVVFGTLTALVAAWLGAGSNFARWLVGFVSLLNLLSGFYSLIALDGVTRGSAFVQAFIAFLVLYVLFGQRGSKEFFER